MAVDVGSAVGYLDLDISGFIANLRNAENEADKRSKNIASKVASNLEGAGKKISSAGLILTAGLTAPLTGLAAAGLTVASSFEKGMSEVRAISGTTGKEFDALRNKAIDLGASTAFSASEVAGAMTEMAKAGWDSQQILDGMGGVLDAAAASGENLGVVSTIVADALTGFGLEASKSAQVADLLTQAANSGTIGITDLGESFKYIAPVASSMGFSMEDVTTAISAMSLAGIKGSQAGTSLRTVLTKMVDPTKEVKAAMSELGIELTNSDGTFKSLDTIIADMRGSFSGLTDEQKTFYASTLAGQEGMSGLLSILNLTQEEYDEIAASMDNAGGVAQETAAIMQDNLKSKVEQLFGSLESLAIKLSDLVIPSLKQFVEWLTTLVDKFTNLSPETQKIILKFAAFAALLGPTLMLIGKFVSGISSIMTIAPKVMVGLTTLTNGVKNIGEGFTLAKAGFSGLAAEAGGFGTKIGVMAASVTGPMLAIAAVVAVLIAAFVNLWKNNEDFRNAIIAIWTQIKETFSTLIEGIKERLSVFEGAFSHVAEALSVVWNAFCALLAPLFEGAFQQVANAFETIVNIILAVLDVFIGFFTGNWSQMWNGILTILTSIGLFVVNTFKNIMNTLKGVLDVVCKAFGTTWSNTWNNIKTFFVNGLNSILSTGSNILGKLKTTFSNVLESCKTIVKNGIDKIKSFFNFSWSLPKLKLPHFTISGKFSLNPPSVPSFGIDWYAKAMGNGMILNSPTIFGFDPKSGKFLGGGEAGSETVVGTSSLMSMIRHAVAEAIGPLVQVSRELTKASADLGYVAHNGFTKVKQVAEKYSGTKRAESGSGDTFNFYSPKAIDEIEAAKQMKKTKRELAEGF